MTDGKSWSPLERRAREWFTRSVEELDAPTLSRLNEARHAALAERAQERRAASGRWRLAAGALASMAILAITLWATLDRSPDSRVRSGDELSAEAIELIVAGEDLDLVADELDFYSWLDEFALLTDDDLG